MKPIYFLLLLMTVSSSVFACSEQKTMDQAIVKTIPKECSKKATAHAMSFAATMTKVEAYKPADGPQKSQAFESSVLYVADKTAIGYNVSMKSKDGWECNYCVTLQLADGVCYVTSVIKHMCAK